MAEEHKTDTNVGEQREDGLDSSITTPVLVGIAVAVLQPELLPGMAIGVAATLAPKVLPKLGDAMRPLLKTAVRAGYAAATKTMEVAAEAGEQLQDIMAEARAEQESGASAARPPRAARRRARA